MKRNPQPNRLRTYLSSPIFWMLAAFIVRFTYLIFQSEQALFSHLSLDEEEIARVARNLLQGNGFPKAPFFKAPLYSLFIALFMNITSQWIWLAKLTQHLLGALLVGIGCDAARKIVHRNQQTPVVIITGIILTFYGPLIRLENRIVLDFLFTFQQGVMLWALLRLIKTDRLVRSLPWVFTVGVAAALSLLTRPTIIPVLPFLAGLTAWALRRKAWYSVATCTLLATLFLLLPLLALLGTGLRNAQTSGELLFTPWQGGFNFYHANHSTANGRYLRQEFLSDNTTGNPTYDAAIAGYQAETPADNQPLKYGDINQFWFAKAQKSIVTHPTRWLTLMLKKSLYLLSEREIYNFEDYSIQRDLSWLLQIALIGFGIIWPFALASLAMPLRHDDTAHARIILWSYLFLMGGAVTLFYTSGRFRMPLVFPTTLLAAAGLSSIFVLTLSRKIIYALLLITGLLLSWTNWWGVRSERLHQYEYARFSQAHWQEGHYQEALDFALLCEKENRNYPVLPLLKAQAYYGLNDIPNAYANYQHAMRKLPDNTTAPCNLGIIEYYQNQNIRAARNYFQQCLKRQPKHQKSAWMLARIALCKNNTEQAADLLLHSSPKQKRPLDYLVSGYALAVLTSSPQARNLRNEITQRFGKDAIKDADEEIYFIRQRQALPPALH